MATETVYGNLDRATATSAPYTEGGKTFAFSFTTSGTAFGTLSNLQLSLTDSAETDSGSIAVFLYSDLDGAPDARLATLGTISDSQVATTSTIVQVSTGGAASVTLGPSVR